MNREMNKEEIRQHVMNHAKSHLNGVFPEGFNLSTSMKNPLCGDYVELKMQVKDSHIHQIGYHAKACALCSASASIMTNFCENKPISEVMSFIENFENSLAQNDSAIWPVELKPVECFAHLKKNITRRVCALLPWVSLRAVLSPPEKGLKQ